MSDRTPVATLLLLPAAGAVVVPLLGGQALRKRADLVDGAAIVLAGNGAVGAYPCGDARRGVMQRVAGLHQPALQKRTKRNAGFRPFGRSRPEGLL